MRRWLNAVELQAAPDSHVAAVQTRTKTTTLSSRYSTTRGRILNDYRGTEMERKFQRSCNGISSQNIRSGAQPPVKGGIEVGTRIKPGADESFFIKAIQLGADRANVFDLRATLLAEHLGRPKDALKDAKMVIRLVPNSYKVGVHVIRAFT